TCLNVLCRKAKGIDPQPLFATCLFHRKKIGVPRTCMWACYLPDAFMIFLHGKLLLHLVSGQEERYRFCVRRIDSESCFIMFYLRATMFEECSFDSGCHGNVPFGLRSSTISHLLSSFARSRAVLPSLFFA